MIRLFHYRN